jgi:hypothetical protein
MFDSLMISDRALGKHTMARGNHLNSGERHQAGGEQNALHPGLTRQC